MLLLLYSAIAYATLLIVLPSSILQYPSNGEADMKMCQNEAYAALPMSHHNPVETDEPFYEPVHM